jgi:branched-chain amino acid transport system ATP-binding protein
VLALNSPLLRVESLVAGYGSIKAVTDVSVNVYGGEITSVLGRNGAGKTTTLGAIAGIVKGSASRLELEDASLQGVSAHRRAALGLALVQEGRRIFRKRSVYQNLVIAGSSLPRRDSANAIELAFARFPALAGKRRERAGSLSGGQQQMLAIAQALIARPKVVMLDEPSAGLAPVIVEEVLSMLVQLKSDGVGILLVEQLVAQARSVSDHVVLIDHGRSMDEAAAATLTDPTTDWRRRESG